MIRVQDNKILGRRLGFTMDPEAEIEIVEAILKGDTIEFATAFELNQRIENSNSISMIAEVVKNSFIVAYLRVWKSFSSLTKLYDWWYSYQWNC